VGSHEGHEILVEIRHPYTDPHEQYPTYRLHTYGLGPAVLSRPQLLKLIQQLVWISNQPEGCPPRFVTDED